MPGIGSTVQSVPKQSDYRLRRECLALKVPVARSTSDDSFSDDVVVCPEAAVGSDEWAYRKAGAGQCKLLFTSSYGYRQFFPIGDAASRSGADPMEGYPSPLAPPPWTSPPPRAVNGTLNSFATASTTAAPERAGPRLVLRFQVLTPPGI